MRILAIALLLLFVGCGKDSTPVGDGTPEFTTSMRDQTARAERLADLRESLQPTEGENGLTHFLHALDICAQHAGDLDMVEAAVNLRRGELPREGDELGRRFLAELDDAGLFEALNDFAGCPRILPTPYDGVSGVDVSSSVCGSSEGRQLARFTVARLRVAVLDGDESAARDAFASLLAQARASSQALETLNQFLAFAIFVVAVDEVTRLAVEQALSPELSHALLEQLNTWQGLAPMDVVLRGAYLEEFETIITGSPPVSERSEKKMRAVLAEALANTNLSLMDLPDPDAVVLYASDSSLRAGSTHTTLFLLLGAQRFYEMRLAGARIVLALDLYRHQNGGYPKTLDELVPTFLPEIPKDPTHGGGFVYRLLPEPDEYGRQYLLYTTGYDAIDNGGVESINYMNAMKPEGFGFDYVLNRPRSPQLIDPEDP
jgi:hypothetical protein